MERSGTTAATVGLAKLGGAAAGLGGVLWAVKVVHDGLSPGEGGGVADPLFFVLPLLFAGGLAGFYVRYSGEMAGEGTAGFAQSFAGLAILVAGYFVNLTLQVEDAARALSFGFIILTLGLVVLGFATLKTEPLPAGNFLPLAMGLLTPLTIIVGGDALLQAVLSALFGVGWLALGVLVVVGPRTGAK
jgi:hypothetical protein